MQTSRKSFRALTMAQPMKKQIDDVLNKLQTQKRKYLALQRQQTFLKEQIQKYQRQLNDAKLLQPKTRVKQNKNNQTNLTINNTDRLYLKTINKISQIKVTIQVHRRQIDKYKKLLKQLKSDIQLTNQSNNLLQNQLLRKQQKNQNLKDHLLQYRNLNMRNTDQFKNSLHSLHKSSIKEQNQRKKQKVLGKNFQTQELKMSKIINLVQTIQNKQQDISQNQSIFMTNSVPLIKQRVRILIHSNKQKLKISQNYKKFGQDLQNMFQIMKQYKGRQDISFIADQFVMKQKQLKKIQQYIGKLQNRSMSYNRQLTKINSSHQNLKQQLALSDQKQNKLQENHFIEIQSDVKTIINSLHQKQLQNSRWFKRIGQILSPLLSGIQFTKSNSDKILGIIQENYLNDSRLSQNNNVKPSVKSPSKNNQVPSIDQKQIKTAQSMELMNYDRLKQYAKQYLANKNQKH